MKKVSFIGAGSLGFTRNLVRDLMTFPLMKDATIYLMDIDAERLDFSKRAVEAIMEKGNYPANVQVTMDRQEALQDADFVICTILAGDVDVWQHDIRIPKKYGVDINVGDTRGVAGIFRALRTVPVMLDICRDMEKICPDAVLLNYTNPMAMLCRAMQRETFIEVTGLCHSVQGTAEMLAEWIGAPFEEIDYLCAGINHQAFYLKYEWNGKDAYPLIREAVNKQEIWQQEKVRNEMFLAFDYYVTESSGHNSEYNPWFRKRQDLIDKYCTQEDYSRWNPGVHAYILNDYQAKKDNWKEEVKQWFDEGAPIELERGHEYAAFIINALSGGEPFVFNGNVANTNLLTNVPQDVCVETPVLADRSGLHRLHVGALPAQLAAMINFTVAQEEMAVEAALTGDPHLVFQAVCYDPLSAAVLSLEEIRKMVAEMLEQNKDYLPQFKSLKP